MALPFIMFDNILEDASSLTSEQTDEAMQPVSSITDWRVSTPNRWMSTVTTSSNNVVCVLAAGQTSNCGIFAGHNLSQALDTSLTGSYTWQYSDNGADYSNLHTAAYPSDDLPKAQVWTTSASHAWYRLRLQDSGGFETAPTIGHAIIGLKLEFSELLHSSFNAYDVGVSTEEAVNENGELLGVNVNRVEKRFELSWDSPGLTEADFFNPASGLTFDGDFVTHAIDNGKPFYLVWDSDEDANGVWTCTVRDFSSPHMDTTTRRRLFMSCHGWREVA